MQDNTHYHGGTIHIFCCPVGQSIPQYRWFDFNNGNYGVTYGSVYPAATEPLIGPHSSEVGSLSKACHSNHSSQVACYESGNNLTADVGYTAYQ